jgi:hypothetical protein
VTCAPRRSEIIRCVAVITRASSRILFNRESNERARVSVLIIVKRELKLRNMTEWQRRITQAQSARDSGHTEMSLMILFFDFWYVVFPERSTHTLLLKRSIACDLREYRVVPIGSHIDSSGNATQSQASNYRQPYNHQQPGSLEDFAVQ